MIVDKVHEVISFGQTKWFEKHVFLKHKKEISRTKIFKKFFLNYSISPSMEKRWKILKFEED